MASPRRDTKGGRLSPGVVGRREGEEAKEVEGSLATLKSSLFSLSLSLSLSLYLSLFCFLSTLLSELYKGPSHSNAHGNSNRYDALFWKFAGFSRSFSNFAVSAFVFDISREGSARHGTFASRRRAAGIFASENCGFAHTALFHTRIDS